MGDLTGDNIWLAYQLHRPSDQTGYIVAFRRAQCPDEKYVVQLQGVAPDKTYSLKAVGTDWKYTATGDELRRGLTLQSAQPRSSLLIFYAPAGN